MDDLQRRRGPEVAQIGPGRVAVEVLIDGLHESRSEPRVFLEVMPVARLAFSLESGRVRL